MQAYAYVHIYFSAYDSKGSRDPRPNLVCGPQAERPLLQVAGSKGLSGELHDKIYILENFRKEVGDERNNGVAESTRITQRNCW